MNYKEEGYLELILGCMFSGKTSRLLHINKMYKIANIPCCLINYKGDKRYDDKKISTHDKVMDECFQMDQLNELFSNCNTNFIKDYKVFIINEGQFFSDLVKVVIMLIEKYKKTVYVCGLDSDFERKPFDNISQLIPYCDKYEKLYAMCKICAEKEKASNALFSLRISNEKEKVVIGSDNYIPVCRKCYLDKSKF